MVIEEAKIISNEILTDGYFVMTFFSPEIATKARPGQFVNVKATEALDPLLPRPISIYDAEPKEGTLKILYFTKGKGTKLLSEKKSGEIVTLTGPLGNYFETDRDNILLVGGGFGAAPLSFFAKTHPDKNIFVATGGRNEALIFCQEDFKSCSAKTFVSTDDGSLGTKGLVTEVVTEILDSHKIDVIFTVGPIPMMKAIYQVANLRDIPVFVSMEEKMACGIGVCYGCSCKTKKGNRNVCSDGPIFNGSEVFFE